MRLTCPSCGAQYEAPEGMVPAEGRHVQCSACHTRWFARGAARPAFSEDQILRRLESRRPQLRAVPDPEPDDRDDPGDFVWEVPEAGAAPSDEPEKPPHRGPVADGDRPGPPEEPGAGDTMRPAKLQKSPPPRDALGPDLPSVPQPRPVPENPVEPERASARRTPREGGDAVPPPSRHWALVLLALAILGGLGYLMLPAGG